jgi:hypothetical protein
MLSSHRYIVTPLPKVRLSAITTPHKLPWCAPLRSLQILLTPTEFYKPWKIYLAPGLIPARMIHVLWLVIVQRTVRSLLLPGLIPMDRTTRDGDTPDAGKSYNPFANVNTLALIAYIIFVILSSILVVTPLEVMTTRLTIQVRASTASFSFQSSKKYFYFYFVPSVITNPASAPFRRKKTLTSNTLVEMRM